MPKLNGITLLKDEDFKGVHILLVNPQRIPHLILVVNNSYFSLTNKRSIISEDFKPFFQKLKRSHKKMLFVHIEEHSQIDFTSFFKKYISVNTENLTCLAPIKEAIAPQSKAEFIFELIPDLHKKGLIKSVQHINMDNDINELGEFNLNTYSKKDIYNYIEKLNRKDAGKRTH